MKNNIAKLFEDFPPVPTAQWEEKIEKDLKGKDYERKLVWRTLEGFKVQPYYRAEHIESLKHIGTLPGEYPYVRGNSKKGNQWYIRQDIIVETPETANAKALDVLMKGADSLGFVSEKALTQEDLELLLKDICLPSIELNFAVNMPSVDLLPLLLKHIKKEQFDKEKLNISIDCQPLRMLTTKGYFCCGNSLETACEKIKTMVETVDDLPNLRLLCVSGRHFSNAGSSIVQELAFTLAKANAYLSVLTESGLPIDKIAPRMKFSFGVGTNYFMEIAKLRAVRLLWSKIVEAYQPQNKSVAQMHIHSVTSRFHATVYDPYVNLLRSTTEAMSAVLGGSESLTIEPFDAVFRKPSVLAERQARNIQNILKEEAYFDKIADPAGGSYYIESLTDSIAAQTWKLFQAVEDKGGYVEAFKAGFIQEEIETLLAKRRQNVANRREIFLGTNQYPNAQEKALEMIDSAYMSDDKEDTQQEIIARPLKPVRATEELESLRLKTERQGKPVKAFMLTYGNPVMRTARSNFSCNFFACAGFEVKDNLGFKTVDEGLEAAKAYGADIVVLCSSDDEYVEIGPEAAQKLADDSILVVAGYPKDHIETLKAVGIKHFIHIKSNLSEELTQFQSELGIS